MNNRFDELTNGLAQSVTRRAALKKFGVGLAGMALACFGLANKTEAAKSCRVDSDCPKGRICLTGQCYTPCNSAKDCRPNNSTGPCCWPAIERPGIGYCANCGF